MMFLYCLFVTFALSLDCENSIYRCQDCGIDESTGGFYCLDEQCQKDKCNDCICGIGYYTISNEKKRICKSCETLTGVKNCVFCTEASPNIFQCNTCLNGHILINGICKKYEDLLDDEKVEICKSYESPNIDYASNIVECSCQSDTECICNSNNNWVYLSHTNTTQKCIPCSSVVQKAVKGICSSYSCISNNEVQCLCSQDAACTANGEFYYAGNNTYKRCSNIEPQCTKCEFNLTTESFKCTSCQYGYALHTNGTCISCSEVFGPSCLGCYYIENDFPMYKCYYYTKENKYTHICPDYFFPILNERTCVDGHFFFKNPYDRLKHFYDGDSIRITSGLLGSQCLGTYGWNEKDFNCYCRYPNKVHNGKCYTLIDCPSDPNFTNCLQCGYIKNWDSQITCISQCNNNYYYNDKTLKCDPCSNKFGKYCSECTYNECTNGCTNKIIIEGKTYSCQDIFGSDCLACTFDGKEAVCEINNSLIEKCNAEGWIYEGKPNHCSSCFSQKNCSLCTTLDECNACFDGFYMSNDDSKTCLSCADVHGITCAKCNSTTCQELSDHIIEAHGKYYTCEEIFGDNCKSCTYEDNIATCTSCVHTDVFLDSCLELYCGADWNGYGNNNKKCMSCRNFSEGCSKCYTNYCYECEDGYYSTKVTVNNMICTKCSEFFIGECSKCDFKDYLNNENIFCTCSNPGECGCPDGWGIQIINETTFNCINCNKFGYCQQCSYEEDKAICLNCTNDICYCPNGYSQTSQFISPLICEYGDFPPFICEAENCYECQYKEPHKCLKCNDGFHVNEKFECTNVTEPILPTSPENLPELPEDLFENADNTLTIKDQPGSDSSEIYKITVSESIEKVVLNNEKYGLVLDFTKIEAKNTIKIESKESSHTSYLQFNENQNANLYFENEKMQNIEIQGAGSLSLNAKNANNELELGILVANKDNNEPLLITSEVPVVFDNIVLHGKTSLESSSTSKNVAAKKVSLQQGASSAIKNVKINEKIELSSNSNLNLNDGVIFSDNLDIDLTYQETQTNNNFALTGLLPSVPPHKINVKSNGQNVKHLESEMSFPIAFNSGGNFDCNKWKKNCDFSGSNKFNKCKCSKSLLNDDNKDNYLYAIYEISTDSPDSPGSSDSPDSPGSKDNPKTDKNGLDAGALAGIIVAVVVVVGVVIFLLVYFLVIKKRKNNNSSSEDDNQNNEADDI